jgi:hypothetical protein
MRLSLSWLIIVLLFIYILYFCQYGWKIYEDFHSTIEGFQTTTDISMSSCPPSESDESIPMRGSVPAGSTQTFCMDSSIQKCSLSVPKESPESCTQYYLALLQSKAALRCPRAMPNYYQDIQYSNNVDKSTRGCTSGARTADGKAPATSESKCTIYTSQMDDLQKLDSCTNIKRLESAQCFSSAVAGVTSALKANTFGSPLIECTFSQIESVKTGSKTTDTNAAAIAAQTAKRAMTAAENAKYDKARQVVAKLGAQGTLVNLDSSSYNITTPIRTILIYAGVNGNYINLSQIQVIDDKGNNVSRNGEVMTTGAEYNTSPNTAVDGSYYPRAYPNIYHSGSSEYHYFLLAFKTPINIASITLYNRTDCCMDRLSKCKLYIYGSSGWITQRLTSDLVQTFSLLLPVKTDTDALIQANLVTEDIFSPESVTYNCTELDSYRSWIDSIRTLYPAKYEASKHNLDSSETWSADKKNTFCTILEQTKIRKTMTNSQLKTTSVL